MSEKNTEIVTSEGDKSLAMSGFYSSINNESFDDKLSVYEAVQNAEQLSDHVGEIVTIKDVILQSVTLTDDDGTEKPAVRSIIIDADGKSFAATSSGVETALKVLFAVVGDPRTWEHPISVKICEKKSTKNGAYKFMTFEPVK